MNAYIHFAGVVFAYLILGEIVLLAARRLPDHLNEKFFPRTIADTLFNKIGSLLFFGAVGGGILLDIVVERISEKRRRHNS